MESERTVEIYGLHFGDDVYCYVGSALHSGKRFKQHFNRLCKCIHENLNLTVYCHGKDLDKLTYTVLATVPVADRLTEEYAMIERLALTHPLKNIIRTVAQHTWKESQYKSPEAALYKHVLRTAQGMLRFNRLVSHSHLWKDVIENRDAFLRIIACSKFKLPPEILNQAKEVVAELRVPVQYA